MLIHCCRYTQTISCYGALKPAHTYLFEDNQQYLDITSLQLQLCSSS